MQLEQLVRQPTEQRLINSASFLKSQLPARLENHIYRLKVRSAASSVPVLLGLTTQPMSRHLQPT